MTTLESSTPILPWKSIVGQAVHDMRTPLSAMRTAVEILKMTADDTDQSRRLISMLEKQIGELTEQLERLVNDPASFASEK